jgi:hypothetical protein
MLKVLQALEPLATNCINMTFTLFLIHMPSDPCELQNFLSHCLPSGVTRGDIAMVKLAIRQG